MDFKPGGIDPDHSNHDNYITKLRSQVLERIQALVNASVEANPEIKSRKKMVQEIYAESLAHLALLREVKPRDELNETVQRVKKLLLAGVNKKHGPIFIQGSKCSGKTGILGQVYEKTDKWFNKTTLKVVRLCTSTPRSAYSLELLRVLCQHISFITNQNDGTLPRDASFHPLYLNNWLSQIFRKIEENPIEEQLIILIDDLHRLHPLESDIVAPLAWLPLLLPPGIHFVVTTNGSIDNLKLTPLQKERFKNTDILVELAEAPQNIPDVDGALDKLEKLVGSKAAQRIGSVLACTEYGLSETEILELVMPTGDDSPLHLTDGQFNFATWCLVKRTLIYYLKIRVMSGRLLFSWRWTSREVARKRYLTQYVSKPCHSELAGLFFAEECEESEEKSPEEPDGDLPIKETPFQSTPQSQDVTYTLRHVEEAWIHLLRAGDAEKLKKLAVCAFDFLLAAVQMISVSYLRCVLEHSRRYLLERDLELVYYATRNSSDALTRDPLQLGAQLISWLRPVVEDGGDLVYLNLFFIKLMSMLIC